MPTRPPGSFVLLVVEAIAAVEDNRATYIRDTAEILADVASVTAGSGELRPVLERLAELTLEATGADASDAHAQLADALGEALLVMLKALSPLERAVFLLREVFDCEYSEIAAVVEKSEENCRQILRRAREGVLSRRPRYEIKPRQEEQILKCFVQAAADGNWAELIEVLSDDATLVCDGSDVALGPTSVQGAQSVAELVAAQASRWLGDGASIRMVRFQNHVGVLAYRNGVPVSSIFLSTRDGEVLSVRVITCPVRLRSLLIVS